MHGLGRLSGDFTWQPLSSWQFQAKKLRLPFRFSVIHFIFQNSLVIAEIPPSPSQTVARVRAEKKCEKNSAPPENRLRQFNESFYQNEKNTTISDGWEISSRICNSRTDTESEKAQWQSGECRMLCRRIDSSEKAEPSDKNSEYHIYLQSCTLRVTLRSLLNDSMGDFVCLSQLLDCSVFYTKSLYQFQFDNCNSI